MNPHHTGRPGAAPQRQADELEHIRTYYRLQEMGVDVAIGGRVRADGREATIVGTRRQYLMVRLDCGGDTELRHATAGMEYRTPAGWIAASPVPTTSFTQPPFTPRTKETVV